MRRRAASRVVKPALGDSNAGPTTKNQTKQVANRKRWRAIATRTPHAQRFCRFLRRNQAFSHVQHRANSKCPACDVCFAILLCNRAAKSPFRHPVNMPFFAPIRSVRSGAVSHSEAFSPKAAFPCFDETSIVSRASAAMRACFRAFSSTRSRPSFPPRSARRETDGRPRFCRTCVYRNTCAFVSGW